MIFAIPSRRTALSWRGLWLCAALAACIVWSALSPAWAKPQVVDVTLGAFDRSRVVSFVVSEPVTYRLFTLANPLRLVVDLPAVDWRTPAAQLERVASRLRDVEAVRFGAFQPGTFRIVFDLKNPIALEDAGLKQIGARYALQLRWREADQAPLLSLGDFRIPPIPRPRPSKRASTAPPLVVIDAGHGGVDPGAIGKGGTKEKTITLAMAKALAAALQKTGRYRTDLTRKADTFVPLRQRIQYARNAKANLFVSIHADSALNDDARGLSVYTLSDNASDREAAALARQENKADLIGGLNLTEEQPEIVSILIDLAQRETKNHSIRFANQLVQSMVLRVPLLPRPVRHAGFAVLKAPDVPAVLIELGFLSHPEEERLLKQPEHRRQIIDGIVAAIDNFFGNRNPTRARVQ